MIDPDAVAEMKKQQAPEAVVRVESKFPSPSENDALGLVKRALAVREPGRVAALFHPGGSSSEEIVAFLSNLGALDGVLDHCDWLSSIDANGLSIDGMQINFKNGDKVRQRVAFLTPDSGGVWKIDFDAFARTVTPSWRDLLEKGADHAVVRVILGSDSYYNGPFADDTQWSCYGMASPDTDQLLLGYCKTDSPQAAALRWMLSSETKIRRATLEIQRVAGASPKQFEIVRVLAEDWVVGPKAFDEGFK
ncbi:MAG: hypothetical protein ABI162_08910 [Luteolibacter sp.]